MGRRGAQVRAWILVPVLFLSASTILSACGSGATATSKASIKATCSKVSAVLSDGPDPAADPVGYAEAQIRPLSQVTTKDVDLDTAIKYLDATYRLFYQTNGSRPAKNSVKAALQLLSVYCPGISQ